MKKFENENILHFKGHLIAEEKSENTVEKYIRDVEFFARWLCGREVTKILVLEYKKELCEKYAPASVNGAIASLNSFFAFMGWQYIKIKAVKIQRQIFSNKELTRDEYQKLLTAAKDKKNERLYYLMQTLCSTGIRISELKFITVSAVKKGQTIINCKGKMRIVILPKELCKALKEYIKKHNIKNGSVFVTKSGKSLDRSYVWKLLKSICKDAGVNKDKVFPHNFRHLFARTYYAKQKDIVRLADILGHSSVNTTRIYTIESSAVHRKQIDSLNLVILEKSRLLE